MINFQIPKNEQYYSVATIREYQRIEVFGATLAWSGMEASSPLTSLSSTDLACLLAEAAEPGAEVWQCSLALVQLLVSV